MSITPEESEELVTLWREAMPKTRRLVLAFCEKITRRRHRIARRAHRRALLQMRSKAAPRLVEVGTKESE